MVKKRIIQGSVIMLGAIMLGILILLTINAHSMNAMVKKEITTLIAEAEQTEVKTFSYTMLAGLPEPVQRYFRYVLKDGQEYIRFVKMKAVGDFRPPAMPDDWNMFITTQTYVTTARPGFIFDAVIKPNAVVWFDARDKYVHGKGGMHVNLLSGFNVIKEDDLKELNVTSLLRWAGEAVMYPTALLPSEYVQWMEIDQHSAKAVISEGGNTGEYRFYFNDVGEIIRYESDDRYDRIDGEFQKVGSVAYRSDYKEVDGIKVPTTFLIARILPDGRHEEFWKGKITDIQFNNLSE